jgi:Cu/Ag efflux protein CusF
MNTSLLRIKPAWIVAALTLAAVVSALAAPNKHAPQPQTFKVAADAKIIVGDNRKATLADLKAGETVNIAYTEENGAMVAHRIRDLELNPEKTPKPEGTNSVPKKPGGNADDTSKHARGIVEKVDVQAGTITILGKAPKSPHDVPPGKPAKP